MNILDHVKENYMNGACRRNGEEEKLVQVLVSKK
jgi:hypothetical protein